MNIKSDSESQLSYLLNRLTDKQRDRLRDKLGWSESTWFRRKATPGDITMDEAETIKSFLDRAFHDDFDMAVLRMPVEVKIGKRA